MLTYVRRVVPFGTALVVSLIACSPSASAPATTAPAPAPPTSVAVPSAKPSVAASVSPSPQPSLTPTVPTATAQATDTEAPTSQTVFVGNTDGQGVYLRNTPATNDRLRAYPDGTPLEIIGPDVEGDGQQWHHVRAPDGAEGYVPVMYTVTSADATQTPAG